MLYRNTAGLRGPHDCLKHQARYDTGNHFHAKQSDKGWVYPPPSEITKKGRNNPKYTKQWFPRYRTSGHQEHKSGKEEAPPRPRPRVERMALGPRWPEGSRRIREGGAGWDVCRELPPTFSRGFLRPEVRKHRPGGHRGTASLLRARSRRKPREPQGPASVSGMFQAHLINLKGPKRIRLFPNNCPRTKPEDFHRKIKTPITPNSQVLTPASHQKPPGPHSRETDPPRGESQQKPPQTQELRDRTAVTRTALPVATKLRRSAEDYL